MESENLILKERLKNYEEELSKKKNSEERSDLEGIVQYLSTIILSKNGGIQNCGGNQFLTKNLKTICGENLFKTLEEVYKKFGEIEEEKQKLVERINEEVNFPSFKITMKIRLNPKTKPLKLPCILPKTS